MKAFTVLISILFCNVLFWLIFCLVITSYTAVLPVVVVLVLP